MFYENYLKLVPEEWNSIDELMVSFKGKFSSINQYMREKNTNGNSRSGVDAESPVCCMIFTSNKEAARPEQTKVMACQKMWWSSCSLLSHREKNYKAIADNFFTCRSMLLILKLKERNIFFLGTVRANRMANCQLREERDLRKEIWRKMAEEVLITEWKKRIRSVLSDGTIIVLLLWHLHILSQTH